LSADVSSGSAQPISDSSGSIKAISLSGVILSPSEQKTLEQDILSKKKSYYASTGSLSLSRQLKAKTVLNFSQQSAFRLSHKDGLFVDRVLPDDTIDRTAAAVEKITQMLAKSQYRYASLEEYFLLVYFSLR